MSVPRDQRLRVLVTGGSGFIGSHVVDRLLGAGHRPRIYDLQASAYQSADAVECVRGDLGDLRRLTRAMEGCDAVIHLAAAADVNEVKADPVEAERRNARGTLHVLEAARHSEVGRVVYASTIWVYSDTPAACHDESLALHPPAHLYTATKLCGEHYCHAYNALYGLDYTVLRFGIPYGPRARPAAVIPAFVNRALAGEPLTIAGDGSQSRRFVYVEDLADGVVQSLAPVASGRTYNLVGTEDVSIREIAEAVRELVGDVTVEHTPGRTADFAGAPVSGDRAYEELGWRATTPFHEGVRRYYEWHRDAAAPVPAASRRSWARQLAGRAALALAWAALSAVLVLGVVTLVPVDDDLDTYDTFGVALLLVLPILLAGGFNWEPILARGVRAALWTAAVASVVVAVAPWSPLDRLGHGHPITLLVFAVTAASATRLLDTRAPFRTLLTAAGD